MYEPVTSLHQDKRPLLVYFHGGGFSTLSIGKRLYVIHVQLFRPSVRQSPHCRFVQFQYAVIVDFLIKQVIKRRLPCSLLSLSDSYDAYVRALARGSGVVVVSVK